MSKYTAEVKEKAYELFMIQQFPLDKVIRKMREDYPKLSRHTLTKWKNDTELDWEGRYNQYCKAISKKSDKERVKKIKPIVEAIEEIRDNVYNQLIKCLQREDTIITDKNIGLVLSAFAKLGGLEYKMKGKKHSATPIRQVINVLIMVLEKNPNVGPVIAAHKHEIEEAIFEEIKSEA